MEPTSDPEFKKKIDEVFEYFKPGKIFKIISKSVSFYEHTSMINFIKNLRRQQTNNVISPGLKILEAKEECVLLLNVKTIDSTFQLYEDIDISSFAAYNSKTNHLRIYLEFLIGNEKGIKILRLYPDINKAFHHARKKIKANINSSIQYQLYDGLDGEVIGLIIEELQEKNGT